MSYVITNAYYNVNNTPCVYSNAKPPHITSGGLNVVHIVKHLWSTIAAASTTIGPMQRFVRGRIYPQGDLGNVVHIVPWYIVTAEQPAHYEGEGVQYHGSNMVAMKKT